MRKSIEDKKLLKYTYILSILFFINLSFLKWPLDYKAIIFCIVICFIIGYTYFIIRKFYPYGDKYILVYASVLSIIGIVMIYRISSITAIKQLVWFMVGETVFIITVVLLPKLRKYAELKYLFMLLTLIFMSMSFFFGTSKHGATNWIIIRGFDIGSIPFLNPLLSKLGMSSEYVTPQISFQPSEFGKIFLVAYLSSALKDYKEWKNLIEPAIIVMVSLGFMVLQRDLGSALIFFGISLTMLYISTSKLKYVLTCCGLFLLGSTISYKLFAHVRVRVMIWQEPWKYATDESYQIVQSMISIASGGLFGTGLGHGYPRFVPVNTTDFIFTMICEEMGILMGIAIIIIYFLLFYRCIRFAIHTEDNFTRLLAVGYSSMIASQVLVIIGGVINVIPLTGITLPLVSYGGSSMITVFFALGILQKISEENR
ncbi:FtsW/RodA/SpoVE family cell cycle protein [Clostridium sediminicola]|uniref:FtsW/RodA/SpoVE family cell cycle protein n=1 Tax=Clostridium sediminicola TaxID=3114879 RepID=UPI0031F20475